MQSSAGIALRALIMLACVIVIPIIAMSGTSWSEILNKFRDFRWPAILNPALASTAAPSAEALGQVAAPSAVRAKADPISVSAADSAGRVSKLSYAAPIAGPGENGPGQDVLDPAALESVQRRLQELGATYYVLESWGNGRPMYRFYCQMAVGGDARLTRHFEHVASKPLDAMRQVLHSVEGWHDAAPPREISR